MHWISVPIPWAQKTRQKDCRRGVRLGFGRPSPATDFAVTGPAYPNRPNGCKQEELKANGTKVDKTFPCRYSSFMKYEVRKTEQFEKWLVKLKDATAKKRLLARLDMASNGHFGDHKQLDERLFELRLFYGPGYRVYFTINGGVVPLVDRRRQVESGKGYCQGQSDIEGFGGIRDESKNYTIRRC